MIRQDFCGKGGWIQENISFWWWWIISSRFITVCQRSSTSLEGSWPLFLEVLLHFKWQILKYPNLDKMFCIFLFQLRIIHKHTSNNISSGHTHKLSKNIWSKNYWYYLQNTMFSVYEYYTKISGLLIPYAHAFTGAQELVVSSLTTAYATYFSSPCTVIMQTCNCVKSVQAQQLSWSRLLYCHMWSY